MSDVSTIPSQSKPNKLARWNLVAAALVVLFVCCVMVISAERAIEIQVVSPPYEDIESTVSSTGTVIPECRFPRVQPSPALSIASTFTSVITCVLILCCHAQTRFSLFAPAISGLVRLSGIGAMVWIFVIYVLGIWTTLFAAWHLVQRCCAGRQATPLRKSLDESLPHSLMGS